ncbi:MAG: CvpA family protein [Candidatus Falkowbacteria bacterium]
MSTLDIGLLVILIGFALNGLFKGLIRLLGHVVGLIIGAYIASHFYLVFYGWCQNIFNGHDAVGKVVSFIILFTVTTWILDFVFKLIEKLFNLIAIIPGSKYINNIAGAILGFIEGALFLGLIIFVVSRYAIIGNFFGTQLTTSVVSPVLLRIVNIIMPILPDALKALKSII